MRRYFKEYQKTKTIIADKFDGTAIYAVYDDSEQSSSKKKISDKYAKKNGDTFTGIMEYEEAITIDDSSAFNVIPNVDYVKNKFNEAKNSHYNTKLVIGKSNTATKDANVSINGQVHINLLDDNTVRSSVIIKGEGAASITANTVPSGDTTIIVTSTDTNDNDKVEQVLTNVNKDYPMLLAYSDTTTEIGSKNVYFTSDIHANPSTGIITAKSFIGSLTGTADRSINDDLGRKIDTTYALINNGNLESATINNVTLTGAAIAPSLATSVKNTRIANADFVHRVAESANTHYNTKLIVGKDSLSTSNIATNTNGNVHINLFDDNTLRNSVNLIGSGNTSITSTVNDGKTSIIVYSKDDNDKVKVLQSDVNEIYPLLASSKTIPSGEDNISAAEALFNKDIYINPSMSAIYAKEFIGHVIGNVEGTADGAIYDSEEAKKDIKLSIIDKYAEKIKTVNNFTIAHNTTSSIGHDKITITLRDINNAILDTNNFIIDNTNIIQNNKDDDNANMYPLLASDSTLNTSIEGAIYDRSVYTNNIYMVPGKGEIYAHNFNGSLTGIASIATNNIYNEPIEGTYARLDGSNFTNSITRTIKVTDSSGDKELTTVKYVKDKFTDGITNYHYKTTLTIGNKTDTINTAAENGNTYLHLNEYNVNNENKNSQKIKIVGKGATSVTSDADGRITIYSIDTNDNDKVAQNLSNEDMNYPILLGYTKNAKDSIPANTVWFGSSVKVNPSAGIITAPQFKGNVAGNVDGEASVGTYARYDDDEIDNAVKQKISKKYAERVKTVNNLTIDNDDSNPDKNKITINLRNNNDSIISSKSFTITHSKIEQKESTTSKYFPILASNINIDSIEADNNTASIFTKSININPSTGTIYAKKFNGVLEGVAQYAQYDDNETTGVKTKIADKYALKINGTLTGSSIDNATLDNSYAEDIIDPIKNDSHIANTKFVQDAIAYDSHHWHTDLIIGNDNKDTRNAATNKNEKVYLNLIDRNPSNGIDSIRSAINIVGTGHTSVTSEVNASETKIIIYSQDDNNLMAQNRSNSEDIYPLLASSKTIPAGEDDIGDETSIFSKYIQMKPSDGIIYANTFIGTLKGYVEGEASIATYARYDDNELTKGDTALTIVNKYSQKINSGKRLSMTHTKASTENNAVDTVIINLHNDTDVDSIISSVNTTIDNSKFIQLKDNTDNKYPLLASDKLDTDANKRYTSSIFNPKVYIQPSAGLIHATTFEGNVLGTVARSIGDSIGRQIDTTYATKNNDTIKGHLIDNSTLTSSYAKDIDDPTKNDSLIANTKFVQDAIAYDSHHWHTDLIIGNDNKDYIHAAAKNNGQLYLNLLDRNPSNGIDSIRSAINIVGTGHTSITSEVNASETKIIVYSTDTNDKVAQNVITENKEYPILIASTADAVDNIETSEINFDSKVRINPSLGAITANTFIGTLKGYVEGEASVGTYARYDDSDFSDTKQKISDKYATNKLAVHNLSIKTNENHNKGITEITITSNNKYNEPVDSKNYTIDNAKIIQIEKNTSEEFPILASDIIKESIQSSNHTSSIFTKSIRINPSTGVIYANKFNGLLDGVAQYAQYDDVEKSKDVQIKIADKYALKINGTLQGSSIDNATLDNSYAEDIIDPATNDSHIANTKFVQDAIAYDSHHWHTDLIIGNDDKDCIHAATNENGKVYLNLIDRNPSNMIDSIRSAINIIGTGHTSVTSEVNDGKTKIIIHSQDDNSLLTQNRSNSEDIYPLLASSKTIPAGEDNIGDETSIFSKHIKMKPSIGIIYANEFIGHLTGNVTGEASIATYARYDEKETGDTAKTIVEKYSQKINSGKSLSIQHIEASAENSKDIITINLHNDTDLNSIISSDSFTINNTNFIQKINNTDSKYPLLASALLDTDADVRYTSAIFNSGIYINPSAGIIHAKKIEGDIDGISEYAIYDSTEKTSSEPLSINDKFAFKENDTVKGHLINNSTLISSYAEDIIDPTKNDSLIANTKFVQDAIAYDSHHWHTDLIIGNDNKDCVHAATNENGKVYLNLIDRNPSNMIDSIRSAINIIGTGHTSVTSEVNDGKTKIIIHSQDDNSLLTQNRSSSEDIYPLLASSKTIPSGEDNIGDETSIFSKHIKMKPSTGIIYANEFIGHLTGDVTGEASIATYTRYDDDELTKGDLKQKISFKYAERVKTVNNLTIKHTLASAENSSDTIVINLHNNDKSIISSDSFIIDNSKFIQQADSSDNKYPLLASDLLDTDADTRYTSAVFNSGIYINPSAGIIHAKKIEGDIDGISEYAIYDSTEKTSSEPLSINDKFAFKENDTVKGHLIDNSTLTSSYAEDVIDVTTNDSLIANTKFVQDAIAYDAHHWHTDLIIGNDNKDCVHAATNENGKVYLNLIDRNPSNMIDSIRSAINIIGTGHTSITSEVNASETKIIVYSTDTNDKVAQNVITDNDEYPILIASTAKAVDNIETSEINFDSKVRINPSLGTIYANTFVGNLEGTIKGEASVATYARYDDSDFGDTKQKISDKYATNKLAVHSLSANVNENHDEGITEITITSNNKYNESVDSINYVIDNAKIIQKENNTSNEFPILASDITKESIQPSNHTSAIFNKSIRINPSTGVIYANKFSGSFDGISEYSSYDDSEKSKDVQTKIADKYPLKINGTLQGSSIDNATLDNSYAENIIDPTTNDSHIANTKFVQDAIAYDAHHYHTKLITGDKTDTISTITNNSNTHIVLIEEDSIRTAIQLEGNGVTTVTSDASGKIIIASTDTNDKVKQNIITDNNEYPILIASKSDAIENIETSEINFDSKVRINPSIGAITANTFIGNLKGTIEGEASIATYARYDYDELSKGDLKQEISFKYAERVKTVNNLTITVNENHENGTTEVTLTSNNDDNESIDSKNFVIDNAKIIQVEDNTSNEFPILASDIIKESIQSSNHTSAIFNKSIRINPSTGVIYANKFSGSFDGISEYSSYDDAEKGKDVQTKIADKYALKINGTLQGSSIDNATLDNSYAEDIDDVTTNDSHIANTKFVQDAIAYDAHHYHTKLITGNNTDTISTITDNDNTHIVLIEEDSIRTAIQLEGNGVTTVTSDASGKIIIASTDTNDRVKQKQADDDEVYPLLASSKTIPAGEDDIGDEFVIFNKDIKMNPSTGVIYANTFIGNLKGTIEGEASVATYARYDDSDDSDTKQKISDKYATNKLAVHSLSANVNENHSIGTTEITITSNNKYNESVDSINFVIDNAKIIQVEDNTSNEFPILASDIIKESIQSSNHTSAIFNKSIRINPSTGVIYANKFSGSFDGISEYASYDDAEKGKDVQTKIADKYALKINGTLQGSSIDNATLDNSYAEHIDDPTVSDNRIATTKFVHSVVDSDGNHWHTNLIVGNDNKDTSDASTDDNGKVHLNLLDETSIRSAINIIGTGHTSVTSTVNEDKTQIIIYSTDTNDKVAQNIITDNDEYPILIASTAKAVDNIETSEINFDSKVRINPSLGAIYANTFIGNLQGTIEGEASIATYARYDDSDDGDTKQKISDKYATNKLAVHSLSANVNENHDEGITEITITSNNKYNESVDSINFVIDNAKIIQKEDNTSNEFPILASDIIKESIQSNNHTSAIFNKSIRINPSIGVIYANKFSGSFDGISEYATYDDVEKSKDKPVKIADKYALKINGTLTGSSIDNATLDNSYAEDIDDPTTNDSRIANTKFVHSVVNGDGNHWHSKLITGDKTDTINTITDNDNTHIVLVEENSIRAAIQFEGSGVTTVTSDASGKIIITSTDTNDKVKQKQADDDEVYPLLASSKTIPAGEDDIGDEFVIFNKDIKMNPSTGVIYANTFIGNLQGTIEGEASIATYARYDDSDSSDTKQKISDKYATNKLAIHSLSANVNENHSIGTTEITITSNNKYNESVDSINFVIDNAKIIQKENDTSNEFPILASDIIKESIQSNNHTSAIFNKSIRINPSTGVIYANKFNGSFDGISEYSSYDDSEKENDKPIKIADKYALKINGTLQGSSIDNATLDNSYAKDIDDPTTNDSRIANTKFVHSVVNGDSNHWHSRLITGDKTDTNNTITDNNNTHIVLIEEDSIRTAIQLEGSGVTTVTSDASGKIIIASNDNNDKVAQNVITENKEYPILIASTANAVDNITAAEINFDSKVRINPSLGAITANTFIGNLQGTIEGEASVATYARYDDSDFDDTKQKISDKYATNKLAIHSLSTNVNENHEDGITEITITSNNKYNESVDSINYTIDNAKIIQKEDNTSNEFPILASDIIRESIQSSNHTSSIFTKSIRINPSTGVIYANKFSGSFDGTSEYATYDNEEKTKDRPVKISDKYALKTNGTLIESIIENATLTGIPYATTISDPSTSTDQIATTKFVHSVVDGDGNHWHSQLITGNKTDTINTITDNSNTHIVLVEENSIRAAIQFEGVNNTSISSDTSGKIIISSTDTNDKVKQNVINNNDEYPVLLVTNANAVDNINAAEINFSSKVHINPSLGAITAETFKGYLYGEASLATNATTANTATYAIYDINGDKIDETYIKEADVITNIDTNTTKHILTFNKDGSVITKSIADNTVQQQYSDTETNEYPLLASSSIASALTTNTTTTARFNKDITINPSKKAITAASFIGSLSGTATNAINDEDGNNIKDTYINKDQGIVDISVSGTTITFTRGNSETYSASTIDENIDIAVQQDKSIANTTFPLLATPIENQTADTYTGKAIYAEEIKINPYTSEIIANKFTGTLNGTATKAEKDGNDNNIVNTYMPKVYTNTVTLSPSGWNIEGDYYVTQFVDSKITDKHLINIIIDKDSQAIATLANMLPINENYGTYIKLYAKNQPTDNITISYYALTLI